MTDWIPASWSEPEYWLSVAVWLAFGIGFYHLLWRVYGPRRTDAPRGGGARSETPNRKPPQGGSGTAPPQKSDPLRVVACERVGPNVCRITTETRRYGRVTQTVLTPPREP
jgi:hypothetical protein